MKILPMHSLIGDVLTSDTSGRGHSQYVSETQAGAQQLQPESAQQNVDAIQPAQTVHQIPDFQAISVHRRQNLWIRVQAANRL